MCFDQKSSFGFALFGLLVSIWIYTRTENVKLAMGQTLGQTLASLTHVDGTQLLGRLLLPSVYLYRALTLLGSLADARYRKELSYSMSAVDTAVAIGLVLGCALVAAGLKSRTIALSLSLLTLVLMLYLHPFFRYAWPGWGWG